MEENNSLQNEVCYLGEQFSEQEKIFLRDEVCKNLSAEFELDGKFYCVLHFPNNQKWKNTNFIDVVKQRIGNQENNFCGTFFSGKIQFKNHIFGTETNFERTFFEDVSFEDVIFQEDVVFTLAALKKSKFQDTKFYKQAFFIETVFAPDAIYLTREPSINFSNITFSEVVFQNSIFNKKAHFNDVLFQQASFGRTKFTDGAAFFASKFIDNVWFDNAVFEGNTEFNHSTFDCDETDKQSAKEKSFVITASFKNAKFQDVSFTKTTFEAVIFEETIFDKVQFWESTFNSLVSFESAILKELDFFKVKFLNDANFSKANFLGKGGFFWSEFLDTVNFSKASFENTSDILFNFTSFQNLVDFEFANFKGYIAFKGNQENRLFISETALLNFQDARIEKPERIFFHGLRLQPNWFVNVDSRKFIFTACIWFSLDGKGINTNTEIKALTDRNIDTPNQLLTKTCWQLAENYEDSKSFSLASLFRQMANESKRMQERKGFHILSLHWWYWLTSNYGENWRRALGILILVLLIFAIGCTQSTFYVCQSDKPVSQANQQNLCEARKLNFSESLRQSLASATFQNVENRKPITDRSEVFTLLEKIFAPLQAALLALAIRRKFMR